MHSRRVVIGLVSSVAALAQRSHDSRVPRSRNPKIVFTPKTKTEHSFPKKTLSLEASRQGRPAAHTCLMHKPRLSVSSSDQAPETTALISSQIHAACPRPSSHPGFVYRRLPYATSSSVDRALRSSPATSSDAACAHVQQLRLGPECVQTDTQREVRLLKSPGLRGKECAKAAPRSALDRVSPQNCTRRSRPVLPDQAQTRGPRASIAIARLSVDTERDQGKTGTRACFSRPGLPRCLSRLLTLTLPATHAR